MNSFKVNLNELKIGLNDFHIIGQNNDKRKIYDLKLNKPDFTLKGLKLSRKTFSNNWITTEKIKQLKKRESIAQEAILMIRDAASNYERDLNSVPKSLIPPKSYLPKLCVFLHFNSSLLLETLIQ